MWTGSKKKAPRGTRQRTDTYGFFQGATKLWLAHRWVYTQLVGPIPPGMELCHTCENPSCVNVAHLRVGTRQQNAKRTKLSNADVEAIRARYALGGVLQQELADVYGVGNGTISRIVNKVRRRTARVEVW